MAEKKSGWLTKAFMGAVKLATVGVVAAVAWQIFLDPLFFPVFHGNSIVAQAWMMKINSLFGWLPLHIGLTAEPGLLSGVMQSFLAPEISALTPPPVETMTNMVPGGLTLDMLS